MPKDSIHPNQFLELKVSISILNQYLESQNKVLELQIIKIYKKSWITCKRWKIDSENLIGIKLETGLGRYKLYKLISS